MRRAPAPSQRPSRSSARPASSPSCRRPTADIHGRSPSPRWSTASGRCAAARTVILATGDPMNYGVARKLLEFIPFAEVEMIPALSAFSLAAARVGWSLPDCDTLTLHGRDAAHIEPFIQPGVRIIVLTADRHDHRRGRPPPGGARLRQQRDHGSRKHGRPARAAVHLRRRCAPHGILGPQHARHQLRRLAGREDLLPPRRPSGRRLPPTGSSPSARCAPPPSPRSPPRPSALLWDVGAGCGSVPSSGCAPPATRRPSPSSARANGCR